MDSFRKLLNSTIKFESPLNFRAPNLSESSSDSSSCEEIFDIMPNNFEQFVEGTSLSEYLERFEAYLALNRVTDELQRSVHFIGVCGSFLYTRIKSACNPRTPMSVPFTELKALLSSILCPRNLIAVERAKFHMRSQNEGESAAAFALALRKMAQTCDFGSQLESQLKDRFVVGLKDVNVRSQVITTLSLEKALSKATTSEISRGLAVPSSSSGLFQVRPQRDSYRQQRDFYRPRGNFQNRNRFSLCGKCGSKFCKPPCRAENYVCYHCEKRGHISRLCPRRRVGSFEEQGEERIGKCLNLITEPPLFIVVVINGRKIKCEIDCGASVSVMTSAVYEKYFRQYPVFSVKNNFVMADNTKCVAYGVMNVLINNEFESQVIIVKSSRESAPLVGRTWLKFLFPDWKHSFIRSSIKEIKEIEINAVDLLGQVEQMCNEIKTKYREVFETHTTPIKKFLVNLRLKPNAVPQFRKPASVPFALRENVSKQLSELEQKKIIKKVRFSDWGSQIVLAPKKNGEIRICCNYKPTLNPFLEQNEYPIPNVDDLIFTLNGNKFFSIIDLSGAYLQLALDEKSQELTTVNTHCGLFSYCRLPFGVKTAPSIFQEVMEKILSGLVGVVSYFDDILVGSPTLELCKERTFAVLDRLLEFNVQANFDKCNFFATEIEYLGHNISAEGVAPSPKKVQALVNASSPRDLTSLRAFLHLLNSYSKFLPDLQAKLNPLHRLLQKDVKFVWNEECENIF